MKILKIILPFTSVFLLNAFAAEESVTLNLKWKHQFQFAGYYAALEKGYYKDAGLAVTIKEAGPNDNSIEAVLSHEADYGVGNSDLLLYRQRGYQPVLLGVFFQHSPLILLARADVGIKTPEDFKGKKILLEPNSNEIKGWLNREHLSENNLTIITEHYELQKFIDKKIDAISAYSTNEPILMDQLGIKYKIFSPLDVGIDFYGDNLFTSEKEMKEHPDRAMAFREASIKGWRYAMSHKEEIAKLIYDKYSKRHSILALLKEADETQKLMEMEFIEPGYYKEGRWRHIANTYAELGMLPNNVSFDGFFYEDYQKKRPEWLIKAVYFTLFAFALLVSIIFAFYLMNKKIKISRQRYRTLYEKAPLAYIVMNKESEVIEWNKEAEKIFVHKKEEVLGKNLLKLLMPPNELSAISEKINRLLNNGEEFISINTNITGDGKLITCEWVNTLLIDEYGEINGMISIAKDITEKEYLLSKLRESEKMFKSMLEQAPFPVIITDYTTGEVLFVNQAIADAFGETKTSMSRAKALDYWVDLTDRNIYIKELTRKGYIDNFEVRFKRKNGTHFWAQMSATRVVWDYRDTAFIVFMDIDTQKKAQQMLKTQTVAIEYAANGFLITDTDGVIEYTNPAFTEITGYTKEEALGANPRILKSGNQDSSFYEKLWAHILSGKTWRGEVLNKRKNGEMYYQLTAIASVKDNAGKIVKFVSILQDITERQSMEAKLKQLAHYDQLTGLPNRTLFFEKLHTILEAENNKDDKVALMFIDLDGFKEINDSIGHEAGDEVLKQVADRITNNISENDFVARMGGDEFTVLITDKADDEEELKKIASKIIKAISSPCLVNNIERFVGASIGIASQKIKNSNTKTLLANADEAMYKAKAEGKNRYFIY